MVNGNAEIGLRGSICSSVLNVGPGAPGGVRLPWANAVGLETIKAANVSHNTEFVVSDQARGRSTAAEIEIERNGNTVAEWNRCFVFIDVVAPGSSTAEYPSPALALMDFDHRAMMRQELCVRLDSSIQMQRMRRALRPRTRGN